MKCIFLDVIFILFLMVEFQPTFDVLSQQISNNITCFNFSSSMAISINLDIQLDRQVLSMILISFMSLKDYSIVEVLIGKTNMI